MDKVLETELSKKGFFTLRLLGTSMGPFVRNGDIAVIKKVALQNIRVGDVLLYHIGNDYFAHRVFKRCGSDSKKAPKSFALKADAVNGIDKNVSFEEVIGKVVSLRRGNYKCDLQSGKWRLINYFILFYSFGLSMLREKIRREN